jgi:hypothetical protein
MQCINSLKLWLVIGIFGSSLVSSSSNADKIVDWIAENYLNDSNLVKAEQFPATRELLEKINALLDPGLRKFFPLPVKLNPSIFIVSSQEWQFGVFTQVKGAPPDSIEVEYVMIVSLRALGELALLANKDQSQWIKNLAGIMFHENGHVPAFVDVYLREGNTNSLLQRPSTNTKKIEFLADVIGQEIGASAGFLRDVFPQTLATLDQYLLAADGKVPNSFYKELSEYHPPMPARRLIVNLRATQARSQEGQTRGPKIIESLQNSKLNSEIDEIINRIGLVQFATLETLAKEVRADATEKKGINPFYISELDRLIAEAEARGGLTSEETNLAFEVFVYLENFFAWAPADSLGLLNRHKRATRKLKFYSSQMITDHAKRYVNNLDNWAEKFRTMAKLGILINPKVLVESFLDQTLNAFANEPKLSENPKSWPIVGEPHLFSSGFSNFIALNGSNIKAVSKLLASVERTFSQVEPEVVVFEDFLWPSQLLVQAYRKLSLKARQNKLDATEKENLIWFLSFASRMWSMRGFLEAQCVIFRSQSSYRTNQPAIDWSFIAEILDLNKSTVKDSVTQALNNYLKKNGGRPIGKPDYRDLLRKSMSGDSFGIYNEKVQPLALSPHSVSLLLGNDSDSDISELSDLKAYAEQRVLFRSDTQKRNVTNRIYQESALVWSEKIHTREDLAEWMSYAWLGNYNGRKSSILINALKLADEKHLSSTPEDVKNIVRDYFGARYRNAKKIKPFSLVYASDIEAVYLILKNRGVITCTLDLLNLLPIHHQGDLLAISFSLDSELKIDLRKFSEQGRFKDFNFLKKISSDLVGAYGIEEKKLAGILERVGFGVGYMLNTGIIRETQDLLVQYSLNEKNTFDQNFELFLILTQYHPSLGTDQLFKKEILPGFLKLPDYQFKLREIISQKRLYNEKLVWSLLPKAFAPVIESLSKLSKSVRAQALDELVTTVKACTEASNTRDIFLEITSKSLHSYGDELEKIEALKTHRQFGEVSALSAHLISMFSNALEKLEPADRFEMLSYLVTKGDEDKPTPFPEYLWKKLFYELSSDVTAGLIKIQRDEGMYDDSDVRTFSKKSIRALRYFVENWINNANESEIIPLVAAVIGARPHPLISNPHWQNEIYNKLFKIEADSNDRIYLESFKEALSDVDLEHEIVPSLAFLLARLRSSDTSENSDQVFAAFSSLGIKLAQISEDWGLKSGNSSGKMKDSAPPMTLSEIDRIAKLRLPPDIYNQVMSNLTILNAASMKTVSKSQVCDPVCRSVAMATVSSKAGNRNEVNIELGRAFLNRLGSKLKHSDQALFVDIFEAFSRQIRREEKMLSELEIQKQMHQIATDIQNEIGSPLMKGWRLEVPKVLEGLPQSEDLIFFELVENGLTFRQLQDSNPAVAKEIGPILATASVKIAFKFNFFDADRHSGNWIIDLKNKKIFWIDFGQLIPLNAGSLWQPDERTTIANFMVGIETKNASLTARAYSKMSRSGGERFQGLTKIIQGEFEKNPNVDTKDRIKQIASAGTNAGWHLQDKFLIGVLKCFLVINKNNYGSDESLHQIFAREIKSYYKARPLQAVRAVSETFGVKIKDVAKQSCNQLISALSRKKNIKASNSR